MVLFAAVVASLSAAELASGLGIDALEDPSTLGTGSVRRVAGITPTPAYCASLPSRPKNSYLLDVSSFLALFRSCPVAHRWTNRDRLKTPSKYVPAKLQSRFLRNRGHVLHEFDGDCAGSGHCHRA